MEKKEEEMTLNNSKGFTFLELLLVIGLLSITAVIVIPSFSMTFENQKFKNFTTEFASYLNQTRTLAITRLVKARLCLDESKTKYIMLVEINPLEYPDQFIELNERHLREPLLVPDNFEVNTEEPNIDFYPDGTTNVSEIKLFNTRLAKSLVIKINKFTGEIKIHDEIK